MRVQDAMVRDVQFCFPDDSLNRVAQLMWDHACGVVPIVDDERRVLGMITDRDVCMAAYTKGRVLSAISVVDVMRRTVRTCSTGDSIATAEIVMKQCGSRRVPVVDAEEHLVGIVSLDDLARIAASRHGSAKDGLSLAGVAETLAEASKSWSLRCTRDAEYLDGQERAARKLSSTAEEC